MQDEEETAQPSFLKDKQLDDYIKTVMGHLRTCQMHSSELQGWHLYKDYVGVRRTIEQVNSTISTLISKIFLHQDIKLKLTNVKLTDQFDMLREGNDALLERINSEVDEASGLKKDIDMEPVIKKVQTPAASTGDGRSMLLIGSKNVQKPQLAFKEKVNNSAKEPFIPLVKEKPNSIKPLSILICLDSTGREYYSHPYEYELLHWSPAPKLLEPVKPIKSKPLAETTVTIVDKVEVLESVVEEMKKCTEIAVDLEHHAFRSYQGLTCLIQVSTRTKDYLIDPLALRGQLTILNEVFTDPKITKVLHGADFDVLWLQRDCGVYLVNLFDTHQASIVLEYPHRSLAALLSKFCGVQANKIYQRADWRIRPLPEDFVEYARQDSHFLLYIYDLMRNELIERGNQLNNLITAVYTRSTELCMTRYEKPIVGPDSHMELYRRSRKAFDSKQIFALRELYLWRDKVAREQDESTDYVLPKHMLLQIAEVLPKEMQGILACCNPIPPLVKTELLTLHSIIRLAREQKHIPAPEGSDEGKLPLGQLQMEDINPGLVISKHDLSTVEDNPRDLPTLLNPSETLLGNLFSQTKVDVQMLPKSRMFACPKNKLKHTDLVQSKVTTEFMSPYQRYTAYLEMKPLLEGEKKKDKGQEDQDHIDRVKEHFMSLTNNTPVPNPVKETKQEPAVAKPVQMEKMEETVPLILSDEVAKVREEKRMKSSAKKRPSDANEESPSKKLKAEEGEEERSPTDGPSQSDSADESTQEDNGRQDEDSMEDVKAFDYEKANYKMFKPSNPRGGKKFKDDRFKTHGKFKPEGNDRGRGGKPGRGRGGFKPRGNHRGGFERGRGGFERGRGGFERGRGGFGPERGGFGRGGRGRGRGRGGF